MLPTIARIAARTSLPILAIGVLIGLATPANAVIDPLPIGPNQYFSGQVNGAQTNAVIRTDCVGPMQTGHPAAGQYVAATRSAAAGNTLGYTGSAGRSLVVSLALPASASTTLIGTLAGYYIRLAIPTTITIPCAGTGNVVFVPNPTSPTARPATVPVTIISLGTTP